MDKKNYYEVSREIQSVLNRIENEKNIVEESVINVESLKDNSDNDISAAESDFCTEEMNSEFLNSEQNIAQDLVKWCINFKITDAAANSLLKTLAKYHPNLPQNIKTLKKVPQDNVYSFVPIGEGNYLHIGMRKKIEEFLEKNKYNQSIVKLDIGVDGVPLTKSSNSQLWPILGNIFPIKEVFLIGA